MALGDYILCCKCDVKLIYDGDRGQREWWKERFGAEPEIECPDCRTHRKPLSDNEIRKLSGDSFGVNLLHFARAIEAAHGIKE